MRIATGIALLMGCAAVALASPIAGPPMPAMAAKPKPTPKPKDDNTQLAVKVQSVGSCPVGFYNSFSRDLSD